MVPKVWEAGKDHEGKAIRVGIMDRNARSRLLTEITQQQKTGGEIAVPLDLFFVGNDDLGSIGCNLGDDQPSIQEFYSTLAALRDKLEVQDVLVRIVDADDDSSWPYTDTIYVISSLPQSKIETAMQNLNFDEVTPDWMYGKPLSAPEPKAGFTIYSVWWD